MTDVLDAPGILAIRISEIFLLSNRLNLRFCWRFDRNVDVIEFTQSVIRGSSWIPVAPLTEEPTFFFHNIMHSLMAKYPFRSPVCCRDYQ